MVLDPFHFVTLVQLWTVRFSDGCQISTSEIAPLRQLICLATSHFLSTKISLLDRGPYITNDDLLVPAWPLFVSRFRRVCLEDCDAFAVFVRDFSAPIEVVLERFYDYLVLLHRRYALAGFPLELLEIW